MSCISEEDVSAKVNKLGASIEIREVLNIKLEIDWLEIFVNCMDLNLVDSTVAHLWQKAGLVLGSPGQSLSCDVTVFETTAWMPSDGKDEVTTSSSNDLTWIVDW